MFDFSREAAVTESCHLHTSGDNRKSMLLVCLLCAPLFWGFVRSGSNAKWQNLPVPYKINSLGLPSSSNASEFVAVQRAFDTWQNIATSTIAFSYQGTTDIVNAGNDGTNIISFRDNDYPFSSGTIAVTVSTYSAQSFLDADIVFNPALSFSTSGKDDAFDIQSIATHEIGHFLGLDHTAIVSATMNPSGAKGSVHPRFLKSDDIIAASSLYPTASFTSTTGGFSGRITNGGANVFGAHVVALDTTQGSPIVSTLSQLDGTYQIAGLPAGTYSVYAEPLDGPVSESDFGGPYDSRVNTNFTTTFLGNTLDFSSRQMINVVAGGVVPNLDIAVLPAPPSTLNLTSPGLGVYGPQGVSGSFPVKGGGLVAGLNFYIPGPGISVDNATFPSAGNATVSVTISSGAPSGLRDLFVQSSDGLSALTGGFIITGPDPALSSVTPNSGGRAGGTRITLSGSNFVPGTVAYVAGLPLSNLTLVDSNTLQGTTPPNASGNLDILIVNPDGTSTVLTGGFYSIAPAGTNQFVPFVIDTAQFRTNLGLTSVSSQAASATVSLYDNTGAAVGNQTVSVPTEGLVQLNNVIRSILGTSQVTNSSGSVIISSDQSLVPYATQIDNSSNDPSLEIGKAAGKTQLLIPSTTSVSPFRSSLILQNVGTADATVHLIQRDTSGGSRKEVTITIPRAGFFQSDDIHATLGLSGLYGPLEITSTNSVPLVATSRVFSPNSAASGFFEGIDLATVANTAVVPITQDTNSFRTNLGINNVGGVQANVSISLYGTAGTLLGSQNATVPAHGILQLNQVNRVLTESSNVTNTTGYIRLSSTQPVAGFSSVINNASNDPGLVPSLVSGATRLLVPSATNVNQFRSTLTLVNLGNSVSARIRLTFRDSSGNILAQDQTIVVPANGIYDVDDILTTLGITSNYGPIQIESLDSVPLAAVSRVYSMSNNTNGFFLAQPF
jgi:matrixin/IPT/TIG domain-containing protein